VLTHTKPGPPPGAGRLTASSVVRPAGVGLAAGRALLSAFSFLGVGFALGEAVGDSAGEGDAAFSAGEGDAVDASLLVKHNRHKREPQIQDPLIGFLGSGLLCIFMENSFSRLGSVRFHVSTR